MGIFTRRRKPVTDVRIEAVAKVTGAGRYSAEYPLDRMAYAVLVGSTIAAGKIESIDLDAARAVEGVIDILTHEHRPQVPAFATPEALKKSGYGLPIFHTDQIWFKGQPIALVVAGTFEDATYAASLVRARYIQQEHQVDFDTAQRKIEPKDDGKTLGSVNAWTSPAHLIDQEYNIATEVHNPMEMHATTAHWVADDKLMLFEKTQGVMNVQTLVSSLWAIPKTNVEVTCEFMGGGFGSGLKTWPHTIAATMAAKQIKRPVKLVLTRPQIFLLVGYRPQSWQGLKLGADASGKFQGVLHQARHNCSAYENFREGITGMTRLIYSFPNLQTQSSSVPLNIGSPIWMRGPGDATGAFALECAIDELSYQLKIDPIELRLRNISMDKHPESGKPWSTQYMVECLKRGSELIGWNKRMPTPAATVDGEWATGYGVACGRWNARRQPANGRVHLKPDGSLQFETAMTDIGTGTGTAVQNLAQQATGIPKRKISVKLGNTSLPNAPSQGGSTGLATITEAVYATCEALKAKLIGLATAVDAGFKDQPVSAVVLSDQGVVLTATRKSVSYAAIFASAGLEVLTVEASSRPFNPENKLAFAASAAHFAQVRVNLKTGKVKVMQYVAIVDGGTIVNRKAATNQVSGAVVGAIGMALSEEQRYDQRYGAAIAADLAGYHVAANADAPIIQVEFLDKPDPAMNSIGSKGIGEVGIIGGAPAIANAIYNATGKRLRNLPITPDKILLS